MLVLGLDSRRQLISEEWPFILFSFGHGCRVTGATDVVVDASNIEGYKSCTVSEPGIGHLDLFVS